MLIIIISIILIINSFAHSEIINWVVAKVGNYTITYYDLKRMNVFEKLSSGMNKSIDLNKTFEELLFTYSILNLQDLDEKIKVSSKEIDNYINTITNTSLNNDSSSEYRLKLFNQYPDLFKLQIQKNQVIRNLLFYNNKIKEEASKEITPLEITNFYENNKNNFEVPTVNALLIAFEQNKNLTLTEMEEVEKVINEVYKTTITTNNFEFIKTKYSDKITFEPYSGLLNNLNIYELQEKGIPDEIIYYFLINDKIPNYDGTLTEVKPNLTIGPRVVPSKKYNKNIYVIVKYFDNPKSQPIPLEKIIDKLDYMIKEDKINNTVKKYITEKIKKEEIIVNIIDKNFEGVYNEILRR